MSESWTPSRVAIIDLDFVQQDGWPAKWRALVHYVISSAYPNRPKQAISHNASCPSNTYHKVVAPCNLLALDFTSISRILLLYRAWHPGIRFSSLSNYLRQAFGGGGVPAAASSYGLTLLRLHLHLSWAYGGVRTYTHRMDASTPVGAYSLPCIHMCMRRILAPCHRPWSLEPMRFELWNTAHQIIDRWPEAGCPRTSRAP